MGIRRDKHRYSVAALLLMLVGFAFCPPETFCRTQAGNRTRSARTIRIDDHDHDHAVDAVSTAAEGHRSGDHLGQAGPPGAFTIPAVVRTAERLQASLVLFPALVVCSVQRGRAPPLFV